MARFFAIFKPKRSKMDEPPGGKDKLVKLSEWEAQSKESSPTTPSPSPSPSSSSSMSEADEWRGAGLCDVSCSRRNELYDGEMEEIIREDKETEKAEMEEREANVHEYGCNFGGCDVFQNESLFKAMDVQFSRLEYLDLLGAMGVMENNDRYFQNGVNHHFELKAGGPIPQSRLRISLEIVTHRRKITWKMILNALKKIERFDVLEKLFLPEYNNEWNRMIGKAENKPVESSAPMQQRSDAVNIVSEVDSGIVSSSTDFSPSSRPGSQENRSEFVDRDFSNSPERNQANMMRMMGNNCFGGGATYQSVAQQANYTIPYAAHFYVPEQLQSDRYGRIARSVSNAAVSPMMIPWYPGFGQIAPPPMSYQRMISQEMFSIYGERWQNTDFVLPNQMERIQSSDVGRSEEILPEGIGRRGQITGHENQSLQTRPLNIVPRSQSQRMNFPMEDKDLAEGNVILEKGARPKTPSPTTTPCERTSRLIARSLPIEEQVCERNADTEISPRANLLLPLESNFHQCQVDDWSPKPKTSLIVYSSDAKDYARDLTEFLYRENILAITECDLKSTPVNTPAKNLLETLRKVDYIIMILSPRFIYEIKEPMPGNIKLQFEQNYEPDNLTIFATNVYTNVAGICYNKGGYNNQIRSAYLPSVTYKWRNQLNPLFSMPFALWDEGDILIKSITG